MIRSASNTRLDTSKDKRAKMDTSGGKSKTAKATNASSNAKKVGNIHEIGPEHRLEIQKWYHGLTSKDLTGPLLKEKGDFLVRATQKGDDITITLNVKNVKADKVDNFVLIAEDGRYLLNAEKKKQRPPTFETVPRLIHYYKRHMLPNGVKLKKGIPRPRWLLSPDHITYKEKDKLGAGNFCTVYKGLILNKIQCAIKVMHAVEGNGDDEDFEKENEARVGMIREADLMATYKHENVIKFLGFSCVRPPMMLVLELCNGGSLDKHLEKYGATCTMFEKELYMFEGARGMKYLHSKKCIHRDLASRNCLISNKGIVKIADFGLSMTLKHGISTKEKMSIVPLRWMSPECLQKEQTFSYKTDIWAYGVLIFEIFNNGIRPFDDVGNDDKEEMKMIKAIRKAQMPKAPEGTPVEVDELMRNIWQKDPEKRPDFPEIVRRIAKIVKEQPPVSIEDLELNKNTKIARTRLPNFDADDSDKEKQTVSGKDDLENNKSKKDNFEIKTVVLSPVVPKTDIIKVQHEGKMWINDKQNSEKKKIKKKPQCEKSGASGKPEKSGSSRGHKRMDRGKSSQMHSVKSSNSVVLNKEGEDGKRKGCQSVTNLKHASTLPQVDEDNTELGTLSEQSMTSSVEVELNLDFLAMDDFEELRVAEVN